MSKLTFSKCEPSSALFFIHGACMSDTAILLRFGRFIGGERVELISSFSTVYNKRALVGCLCAAVQDAAPKAFSLVRLLFSPCRISASVSLFCDVCRILFLLPIKPDV